MYEYIRGKYKGINRDYIIIENNGIGYKIFTSGATMSSMPKIDEEVKLYLEQIVREDFLGLYGFDSREELEMFKLLLSINGVGAKAALSLLSISRINNLRYAIMMGDEKHLCKAPGIGKKTAGRIILELKDKIKKEDISEVIEGSGEFEDLMPNNASNIAEALGALLALGYSEKEAETALKKVDKTDTLENIIKNCLKVLMG
ncbi:MULTISPECIES: Holliday junction branch migration protein RuvA [Clostridium]|jgi:holliday junction DNA helicase RuvA|uniref:Holliday junction branch migration protein RuvA n=1 Tax=Clostridium TaxID=1485 RepID=UPI000BE46C44|nr:MULTISPECIES: Holliday junction branch migration protein RuvA [Clostridium]MBU6135000.1 Holliday junction branch migration protein RuvA [Clostridium tertium]MDB1941077.1 Holliday junction branch migration protein RuvA [Clostridium tertium]MDB1968653.1 Holliday junction branch migration protein RuvA [Clostridium tertium]MDI9216305.1 Holliday junction branch migration protein RuvA [Clostridium tertium]MDU2682686.1 Holliday junction branch migration protein RuvA [Clostridium sp.]